MKPQSSSFKDQQNSKREVTSFGAASDIGKPPKGSDNGATSSNPILAKYPT